MAKITSKNWWIVKLAETSTLVPKNIKFYRVLGIFSFFAFFDGFLTSFRSAHHNWSIQDHKNEQFWVEKSSVPEFQRKRKLVSEGGYFYDIKQVVSSKVFSSNLFVRNVMKYW